MLKRCVCIFFSILLFSTTGFSQLEFMQKDRLFFLGSEMQEKKWIIAGLDMYPKNKQTLSCDLSILDNWVMKDSVSFVVQLDTNSISRNNFFVSFGDSIAPAYRFFNSEGFEVLVMKEIWYEYYNQYGEKQPPVFKTNGIMVTLPSNKKYYTDKLPFLHEK